MDIAAMPRAERDPVLGGFWRYLAARLSRDDRRIRRACAQRESLTGDRPTVTVIRGPVPDFLQDMPRISPAHRSAP